MNKRENFKVLVQSLIATALIIVTMLSLCACGNMSMGLGNFTFNHIHITTRDYSGCLTVEKWYESNTGIEVNTKEYGPLYLSEGQYMLISDKCPICDAKNEEHNE